MRGALSLRRRHRHYYGLSCHRRHAARNPSSIGAHAASTLLTGLSGTSPQRLLDHLASRIIAGNLDAAVISSDNLEVVVSYGGGCEVHQFNLCWNGLVMESLPPQVNLSLIHEDNNDSCLAMLTEQLSFDLTPLQASASQGEIVIHFEGQTLNYTF